MDCERAALIRGQAYARLAAEQRAASDGETTALGGGWFATAAGDAWYRYYCRLIWVQARHTSQCYSALPVILSSSDLQRYYTDRDLDLPKRINPKVGRGGNQQEEGEETKEIMFFLEPHTHRLTTVGIQITCVEEFAPLYRNTNNNWMRITSTISSSRTPIVIDITVPNPNHVC
jgi:hypothetical protein